MWKTSRLRLNIFDVADYAIQAARASSNFSCDSLTSGMGVRRHCFRAGVEKFHRQNYLIR